MDSLTLQPADFLGRAYQQNKLPMEQQRYASEERLVVGLCSAPAALPDLIGLIKRRPAGRQKLAPVKGW